MCVTPVCRDLACIALPSPNQQQGDETRICESHPKKLPRCGKCQEIHWVAQTASLLGSTCLGPSRGEGWEPAQRPFASSAKSYEPWRSGDLASLTHPPLPNACHPCREAEREEILHRKLEEQQKLREACDQVVWSASLSHSKISRCQSWPSGFGFDNHAETLVSHILVTGRRGRGSASC